MKHRAEIRTIVQEYIEGQTLRALLADRFHLPRLVEIGIQIARALAAAHAAGIVHHDIKPENIMVRADGYVKVLDFGIARRSETQSSVETTRTNVETAPQGLTGTPSYMSPEGVLSRPVGPAADIFSLGVVLYEMATGQRPFIAPTSLAIMASLTSDVPVTIARLAPELPRVLDELVQSMLEKSPERRPTAQQVETSLEQCGPGTWRPPDRDVVRAQTTVGREVQLEQLRAAYSRVRDGRSVILGISGEPGIGKTSLLDDFLGDLADSVECPTVARARCAENLAGNEAYLPVLEALDSLLSLGGGSSFDALVRTVAPTWYTQVAPQPSGDTTAAESRGATPVASQERMKRELCALFQDLSRRAPLVWVIDDLHWADVSTIDLLSYLAGHFADMRVLVLTCFRPSDMALVKHPFLAIRNDLQSKGLYGEIDLTFLTQDDVSRISRGIFPHIDFRTRSPRPSTSGPREARCSWST